jgi:hypothetical protein
MAEGVAPITTRADPALKALARTFRCQRMLDEGRYASSSKMAQAEHLERGYLGALLRPMLPASELVAPILNGQAYLPLGCRGYWNRFRPNGRSGGQHRNSIEEQQG